MTKAFMALAGGIALMAAASCTDEQLSCAGGATAGGAVGAVAGSQIGSGSGRTAATILGTGAGAYAGNRAAGC